MFRHVLFYSLVLRRLERSSAARRYIVYIALSGVVGAMMQFGEVIARKSLGASGLAVTLLVMTMPIAAFTSLWWARLIEGRNQSRLLIFVGAAGYLVMATGAFLTTIEHLIGMSFLYFLAFALIGPSENRLLQQHISSKDTGTTFGWAQSTRMGVTAAFSGIAGFWMEHVPNGYQMLYPIAALFGFIALCVLASVPTKGQSDKQPAKLNSKFILSPLKDVFRLLKFRKDYLRFEIAFMFYGIAFMMTLPVVPLYLVDNLELGYDTIGLARGTVNQTMMIIAIPIFGKLFDRSTPHRLASIVFAGLGMYPLILLSASFLEGSYRIAMVYIGFGYFGVIMSGIMVLWQLSSIRFSGNEDAGVFQSVHIAATGVRGSFAPLLGYFVMNYLGINAALITATCIFFAGSLIMIMMRKIDIKLGHFRNLRAV